MDPLFNPENASVENLVVSRRRNIEKIKIHHQEFDKPWASIVRLTKHDINNVRNPSHLQKRCEQFFVLGLSFSVMMRQDNGPNAVRAAAQLLEEYEYFIANGPVQSMKSLRAKNLEDSNIRSAAFTRDKSDPYKPQLYKSGKHVIYEFLEIANIPFDLDYSLIVCSLCDILQLMYSKFLDPQCIGVPPIEEAILRLDERIRDLVIKPIVVDVRKKASDVLEQEFATVSSDFGLSKAKLTKKRQDNSPLDAIKLFGFIVRDLVAVVASLHNKIEISYKPDPNLDEFQKSRSRISKKSFSNRKILKIHFEIKGRKMSREFRQESILSPTNSLRNKLSNTLRVGLAKEFGFGSDDVGIERFEFLRVIGRGTYGKVMIVRRLDNGKIYAIKTMRKELIFRKNATDFALSELNVWKIVAKHPFAVQLRCSFQSKTKLYFVMEYYAGGELFWHLRDRESFTETQAKYIIAELCSIIGFMHSKNILYRDIKPENIVLEKTGHVRLADFGFAIERLKFDSRENSFVGTPEYMAPELIDEKNYGRGIDWWACGILLYELIFGIPPFYSKNLKLMCTKIQNDKLEFDDEYAVVSEQCKDFLTKILDKDEARRLGSGPRDVEELKIHPFFSEINWDDLDNKTMTMPFIPETSSSEMDSRNFVEEFTSEDPVDTPIHVNEYLDSEIFKDWATDLWSDENH